MIKSHLLGAVYACLLLLCFQSAHANSVDGSIHLSLNPTFNPATDTTGNVGISIFDLYVIGDNFTDLGGIGGVEFSISSTSFGTDLNVLSFTPASSGVNFGSGTNVIMGYPVPLDNTGQVLFGTYQIFAASSANDMLISLGPSSPSSFGGVAPGWAQGINPEILHPFGFSSDLLLNQNTLPAPPGTPPTPEIPIPAAVWLFGSGLLGLIGVARRKKSSNC